MTRTERELVSQEVFRVVTGMACNMLVQVLSQYGEYLNEKQRATLHEVERLLNAAGRH